MYQIQVLTHEDTEQLLTMKDVISRIESVYTEKANHTAAVWPMVFYEFEPGRADMDIKSGCLREQQVYGLKLVSWFGDNPQKGLPALTGAILLFDLSTGQPLGLINGDHVTGMRTGAAGALGIKYLARKDSETLLMVGTGHQAAYQLSAAITVSDSIKRILIHSPLNPEHAAQFCKSFELKGAEYHDKTAAVLKTRGITLEPALDLKAAVQESDIIITATPSRVPLIKKDWVKPGTHFSCMGSDMPGKQEIDETIMGIAKVVVDDLTQAIAVGEVETALHRQILSKEEILGEIGDLITGRIQGRTDKSDITVFDSTGIGLQDLSVGALALENAAAAEQPGAIGTRVEF